MPTSKTLYLGQLRTESTHLKSGKQVLTDAPTDNEGKGEAFSPTDLMASSLASCMFTIMGINARKNGFQFEEAEAEVTKIMADNPRRVSEIIITLKIKDQNYSQEQKQILLEAAENCPVAKSLHPDLKQTLEIDYI